MYRTTGSLYYVYALLLVSLCHGILQDRDKRRIVAGDDEVTVEELNFQCCATEEWADTCCLKHEDLKSKFRKCLDGLEVSPYFTNPQHKSVCTAYGSQERKAARYQYCSNIYEMNRKLVDDVIPTIKKYGHCSQPSRKITKPDQETYRTMAQIEKGVLTWHDEFVAKHSHEKKPIRIQNCCGKNMTIVREEIADYTDTTLSYPPDCPVKVAKAIRDFMSIVLYTETIERFGRKPKMCLRGCIGLDSMECVRDLFEYVIPPAKSLEEDDAPGIETSQVTYRPTNQQQQQQSTVQYNPLT